MDRFRRHIEKLQAAAPSRQRHPPRPPRFDIAVVRDAFNRLPLEEMNHPDRIAQFMNLVELIESKLPVDRYDLDDHIRRGIPFAFVFVSEADRTLQFYSLQLPFAFDPSKTYPLTIYLHGAAILTRSTACPHPSTTPTRTPSSAPCRSTRPTCRPRIAVSCWLPRRRGNSMYRAYGELDVWQCLAMVKQRFKIDPDHIYLTGFSMGCSGAMAIAGRRPDIWAGVNLASGFGDWSETNLDYLADNLGGMPMAVWIGELDGMVDGARSMHQRLLQKHIEHRFEIAPQLPHTYPYDEFQKNVGYLMQFTRRRPAEFTYVADGNDHAGRNGVFMNIPRNVSSDKLPTFTCSIVGQNVAITSQNTIGLWVDLGPDGLGLTGEVAVNWNGQQAYTGPVKVIALGQAPGPWGRR